MDGSSGLVARSSIPAPTVIRLPVYHRSLAALAQAGTATVSSADLSLAVGVNAATLRRDLSRLGSIGTRGTGYDVTLLLRRVEAALALDQDLRVAIVGVGNLGRALCRSRGFSADGFRVVALFDANDKVVGTTLDDVVVDELSEMKAVIAKNNVKIGVITTPAFAAQETALRLCEAGVTAILNFAPIMLNVADNIVVRNVDLGAELQVLAFYGARSFREVLATAPTSAPMPTIAPLTEAVL